MGIPAIPTRHQDETAHRQRIAESINSIRDFTFDDSRVRTQAEIAANVTPVNYAYAPGDVRRYGAQADGVTNDFEAIKAALDQGVRADGAVVHLVPYGVHYIGSYSVAGAIFSYANVESLVVEGNFATVKVTTTTTNGSFDAYPIFQFEECSNLTFRHVIGTDTGTDITVNWKGAVLFQFSATSGSGTSGSIRLVNCKAISLVALFSASGNVAHRIQGITLDSCSAETSYYGITATHNGDLLRATNFRFIDGRRAYFVYGVVDHHVEIFANPKTSSGNADALCLVKTYDANTKNIRLRVVVFGLLNYNNIVNLEHDNSTGVNTTIENIDIDVRITDSSGGLGLTMYPLAFTSYSNGVQQTSTTNNVWRNIHLKGGWSGIAYTRGNAIAFTVSPVAEECSLFVDALAMPSVGAWRASTSIGCRPGFCIRWSNVLESRFTTGDLTSTTAVIPLAQYDTLGFTIRVRVWAHDNWTSAGAQNLTYEDRIISGYNAGGGNVTIQTNTSVVSHSVGTAATISYTASGENINVTFAGATYNGANAGSRVDVEYLSTPRMG